MLDLGPLYMYISFLTLLEPPRGTPAQRKSPAYLEPISMQGLDVDDDT